MKTRMAFILLLASAGLRWMEPRLPWGVSLREALALQKALMTETLAPSRPGASLRAPPHPRTLVRSPVSGDCTPDVWGAGYMPTMLILTATLGRAPLKPVADRRTLRPGVLKSQTLSHRTDVWGYVQDTSSQASA